MGFDRRTATGTQVRMEIDGTDGDRPARAGAGGGGRPWSAGGSHSNEIGGKTLAISFTSPWQAVQIGPAWWRISVAGVRTSARAMFVDDRGSRPPDRAACSGA